MRLHTNIAARATTMGNNNRKNGTGMSKLIRQSRKVIAAQSSGERLSALATWLITKHRLIPQAISSNYLLPKNQVADLLLLLLHNEHATWPLPRYKGKPLAVAA
jgi:hypothetical protein